MNEPVIDHLALLVELAIDAGDHVCLPCIARDREPAGNRRGPAAISGDLDVYQAGACELVIAATQPAELARALSTWGPASAARRLCDLGRVALLLFPAVARTPPNDRRSSRGGDEADDASNLVDTLAPQLTAMHRHLEEHDTGTWVDPRRIAGTIADLIDSADALAAQYEDELFA